MSIVGWNVSRNARALVPDRARGRGASPVDPNSARRLLPLRRARGAIAVDETKVGTRLGHVAMLTEKSRAHERVVLERKMSRSDMQVNA